MKKGKGCYFKEAEMDMQDTQEACMGWWGHSPGQRPGQCAEAHMAADERERQEVQSRQPTAASAPGIPGHGSTWAAMCTAQGEPGKWQPRGKGTLRIQPGDTGEGSTAHY